MTSIARSAGSPCERCIQVFRVLSSKVQGSIQQTSSYAHLWISRVQKLLLVTSDNYRTLLSSFRQERILVGHMAT